MGSFTLESAYHISFKEKVMNMVVLHDCNTIFITRH